MALLLYIMRLATFLRLAMQMVSRSSFLSIFNGYFPRVPPSNWDNRRMNKTHASKTMEVSKSSSPEKGSNMEKKLPKMAPAPPVERISPNNNMSNFKFPKPVVEETPTFKVEVHHTEDSTPAAMETSTSAGFSIYSDISAPDLNKAMFITPPRPSMLSAQEYQYNLLKDASDRVSEILRENRRRLDSGEDCNAIRKEARRRRAQELAASRGRGGLFV